MRTSPSNICAISGIISHLHIEIWTQISFFNQNFLRKFQGAQKRRQNSDGQYPQRGPPLSSNIFQMILQCFQTVVVGNLRQVQQSGQLLFKYGVGDLSDSLRASKHFQICNTKKFEIILYLDRRNSNLKAALIIYAVERPQICVSAGQSAKSVHIETLSRLVVEISTVVP